MKYFYGMIAVGLTAILFACNPSDPEVVETDPAAVSSVTQEVLNHHLEAFGANDINGIMEDYTEESVIMTNDKTYNGLDEIRGMFEEAVPLFPTEGTEFILTNTVVDGQMAYIVWNARTPFVEAEIGTDTFIIEDGKIKRQTFTALIEPVDEEDDDDEGDDDDDNAEGTEN